MENNRNYRLKQPCWVGREQKEEKKTERTRQKVLCRVQLVYSRPRLKSKPKVTAPRPRTSRSPDSIDVPKVFHVGQMCFDCTSDRADIRMIFVRSCPLAARTISHKQSTVATQLLRYDRLYVHHTVKYERIVLYGYYRRIWLTNFYVRISIITLLCLLFDHQS